MEIRDLLAAEIEFLPGNQKARPESVAPRIPKKWRPAKGTCMVLEIKCLEALCDGNETREVLKSSWESTTKSHVVVFFPQP